MNVLLMAGWLVFALILGWLAHDTKRSRPTGTGLDVLEPKTKRGNR